MTVFIVTQSNPKSIDYDWRDYVATFKTREAAQQMVDRQAKKYLKFQIIEDIVL